MPKYSIEYKKKVVKYFQKHGESKTVKKFNHFKSVIRQWHHKYEEGNMERKPTKQYTVEEKLEILNYLKEFGITETEKKFNMNRGTIHKWERKYLEYGAYGLENHKTKPNGKKRDLSKDKDFIKELQELRLENEILKKLEALDQMKMKRQIGKKR